MPKRTEEQKAKRREATQKLHEEYAVLKKKEIKDLTTDEQKKMAKYIKQKMAKQEYDRKRYQEKVEQLKKSIDEYHLFSATNQNQTQFPHLEKPFDQDLLPPALAQFDYYLSLPNDIQEPIENELSEEPDGIKYSNQYLNNNSNISSSVVDWYGFHSAPSSSPPNTETKIEMPKLKKIFTTNQKKDYFKLWSAMQHAALIKLEEDKRKQVKYVAEQQKQDDDKNLIASQAREKTSNEDLAINQLGISVLDKNELREIASILNNNFQSQICNRNSLFQAPSLSSEFSSENNNNNNQADLPQSSEELNERDIDTMLNGFLNSGYFNNGSPSNLNNNNNDLDRSTNYTNPGI